MHILPQFFKKHLPWLPSPAAVVFMQQKFPWTGGWNAPHSPTFYRAPRFFQVFVLLSPPVSSLPSSPYFLLTYYILTDFSHVLSIFHPECKPLKGRRFCSVLLTATSWQLEQCQAHSRCTMNTLLLLCKTYAAALVESRERIPSSLPWATWELQEVPMLGMPHWETASLHGQSKAPRAGHPKPPALALPGPQLQPLLPLWAICMCLPGAQPLHGSWNPSSKVVLCLEMPSLPRLG